MDPSLTPSAVDPSRSRSSIASTCPPMMMIMLIEMVMVMVEMMISSRTWSCPMCRCSRMDGPWSPPPPAAAAATVHYHHHLHRRHHHHQQHRHHHQYRHHLPPTLAPTAQSSAYTRRSQVGRSASMRYAGLFGWVFSNRDKSHWWSPLLITNTMAAAASRWC